MRYKNNVLDKLNQADTIINRLTVQVNRNVSRDEILETLTLLKEQIESTREMVSIEHDDFAQQFAPR
jgi:DNA-directed RNA polymerase specialized sigma subunit